MAIPKEWTSNLIWNVFVLTEKRNHSEKYKQKYNQGHHPWRLFVYIKMSVMKNSYLYTTATAKTTKKEHNKSMY